MPTDYKSDVIDKPSSKAKIDWDKEDKKEKIVEPVKETFLIVKAFNKEFYNKEFESLYPFGDLEEGEGFFVPNKNGLTTDQTLEKVHKAIILAREFYAEPEFDALGNEILETLVVKSVTRNTDGSPKLAGDGTVLYSAEKLLRPKLMYSHHFVAYPTMKDYDLSDSQKAPEDGVIVVRVD